MKQKKLGVFLYNRLFDPLIQSNFWLYIADYLSNNKSDEFQIYLITYENPDFPLTTEQLKLVASWEGKGLIWTKLNWNPGIGYLSKIKDINQGFWATLKLRVKGVSNFVSLASVAGSFIYLYSIILRYKFFLYQFEPHSEYAIDNKMWPKKSLQFKISNLLEFKAARNARVISSGTRFMGERLKRWKVNAKFFKIPTVVNDAKFLFSNKERDVMRKSLNFKANNKVLFYPGKFGDLYYTEEIPMMFKWLWEEDNNLRFLVITPHLTEEITLLFKSAGLKDDTYRILHSSYEEIHKYFHASDFAVIAVPPGPSKKFISNIKVGEYLTAGLPFLITEGISEDYLVAQEKEVGVVVKDFEKQYIKKAWPEINNYLDKDQQLLREHCREIGLGYRGFNTLNPVFKMAINSLFE